jgi:hypothetical protein
MVNKLLVGAASVVGLGFASHLFAANVLVKNTMSASCIPDSNTVVNPTADAVTALGVSDAADCVAAAGWSSGTNFTNGYRSVRLGKQNRTCDSEVDVQSTAALQPGTGKLSAWTCNATPCVAAGASYLHCTATSN